MLFRWKKQRHRSRFYKMIRDIANTRPLEVKDAPWSIISMVSNSDVQMYLLSMKSFYTRMGRGKLIAIVDRDMPTVLRETLKRHFVGIRLTNLEDINVGSCQRGGTWERLLYVIDHSEHEYAIQIDCDTLAFGPNVEEIYCCAEHNIPFTLGTKGCRIDTMESIAEHARKLDSNYIGIVAERLFDQYPDAQHTKYVRASSGFAGFAKGGFSRSGIEEFHSILGNLVGTRWTEWGTEQNASNFAVANSPNGRVLPYPKYANYGPNYDYTESSFLHFFGTYRYLNDHFANLGKRVISELRAAAD